VFTSFTEGNPAPMPYVPLANPLELMQCIGLIILLQWMWHRGTGEPGQTRWVFWSILAFIVLNGIVARSTHFFGGVPMDPSALWESAAYQTAVSIVWTTAALVAMASASGLRQRSVWFGGAALLGAVVVKLFLVDLDDVGTVARIVSFVGVGLLMLLVGYVSPLPPRPNPEPRT
jgi:uncharacterized membrane protein